ncbi:MAG: hypothetical protein SGI77_24405 [Pirellulaceae bacterium]|nr:hypothetical protein [Pirellulaceae bacterium]
MSATVKIVKNFNRVKKVVNDSVLATFGDAARLTRTIARRSIRRRAGSNYALAGQPPRTRFGSIRNSILFDVDNKSQVALIGPAYSRIGPVAAAHEHGGFFRRRRYEARPFMRPAFEKVIPRLPKLWRYSIR